MLKSWTIIALLGSLALAAPAAEAQSRGNDKSADVPRAYVPPPGMCRVWLDDVPAGQQPAPTDCRTALRKKPPKAQVIFGDDYVRGEKKRESSLKGFREGDRGADRNAPRPASRAPERKADAPRDRGDDRKAARPKPSEERKPIWRRP
jgi:hypothetical protein